MEPKIIIRVEGKTGDCENCFYWISNRDGGKKYCQRPAESAWEEPCFDEYPGGKYFIFIEKN